MSNFVRLLAACVTGAIIASVATYYAPLKTVFKIKSFAITYTAVGFIVLACVRLLRSAVRDFFYAIDCSRLKVRKDVSRILVYGTGLRYRAFRRELVRSASRNSRIIVGLLDDDVLLWGKYIGGMKILGGLGNAAETVNSVNADSLVIACELSDARLAEIAGSFKKLGIKVSVFSLNEKEV